MSKNVISPLIKWKEDLLQYYLPEKGLIIIYIASSYMLPDLLFYALFDYALKSTNTGINVYVKVELYPKEEKNAKKSLLENLDLLQFCIPSTIWIIWKI